MLKLKENNAKTNEWLNLNGLSKSIHKFKYLFRNMTVKLKMNVLKCRTLNLKDDRNFVRYKRICLFKI